MNKTLEYRVRPEEDGKTLKEILHGSMGLTVRQIRSIKFSEEGLKVNGSRYLPEDDHRRKRYVTTKAVIHEGDVVTAFFEDDGPGVEPVGGTIEILYEDRDILFLNKPAGLVAHPAHGHYTDTLVNRLAARYQEPVRLIGRLDKDTSGVIAAVRNAVAANRMEIQRKEQVLSRQYLALVHGTLEGSGLCDIPLIRFKSETKHGRNGQALSLMMPSRPVKNSDENAGPAATLEEGALPSKTEWTALETREYDGEQITLVRLHLLTGRTHQIRAHMAAMGHPLLGDDLYGDRRIGSRTMLHSVQIDCVHPFTGESLTIQAPLPEDFSQIWEHARIAAIE